MKSLTFLLLLLMAATSYGQNLVFRTNAPNINSLLNKAISNSESFISHVISNSLFKQHFILSLPLSEAIRDSSSAYNPVYFTDSIPFTPQKYELRYFVIVGSDTLDDSFIIPVDSVGNVDIDTTTFHYLLDNLKAYGNLFHGKYKFNYDDVKKFIQVKGLKNYSVRLMNSSERIYEKDYLKLKLHKYYWYVYFYFRGNETVYRIDPDTGKYTRLNRKLRALA